jgi:hypothetical protein
MTTIGTTGHQHIPETLLPGILAGIGRVLASTNEVIGLTSLAAGADQHFARAVLDGGGRLHAIIPCERYETAFANDAARASYFALLAAAANVETLPYDRPSGDAFMEAGKLVVDRAGIVIAVWDGTPSKGLGGTADVVRYAREQGREVIIIWPPG